MSDTDRDLDMCASCGASLIWVRLDGKPVAVWAPGRGRGDVALELELFPRAPGTLRVATRIGTSASLQVHKDHCPGARGAFSAAGLNKKKGR